jgi:NHL repeat
MPRMKFRLGAVACVAASLLTGVALADQSIAAATPLVVPDQGNNRVLIYLSPTTTNQAADVVLGQGDFTSSDPGTSSTTMSGPTAFTFDSEGNLYVSDTGNCRVLVFNPPFTSGEAATLVIGQPDANTGCGGAASASTLAKSGGVAIDKRGNLWVADSGNNRLLKFLAPLKTGENAKTVVGQPDFVSNGCTSPPTAATLCTPVGLVFDFGYVLWVADSANNRVLAFRSPVKGGSANVEYGHPAATAFTSNTYDDGGVSASSLGGPTAIGFDPKNRLWVADTQNSRVLIFQRNFHVNGEAASFELGQSGFGSSFPNNGLVPTAATLSYPQGIVTLGDNVWVGDTGNNRTLQFTLPVSDGVNASLVLGQPDFSSISPNQGGSPSEQTQNEPFGAGPSLIALAVLALMAGGWHLRHRLQRAS